MRYKRNSTIDDETLENMKRYYKIDNHKELLQYIKKNGIIKGDIERDWFEIINPKTMRIKFYPFALEILQ